MNIRIAALVALAAIAVSAAFGPWKSGEVAAAGQGNLYQVFDRWVAIKGPWINGVRLRGVAA